MVRKELSLNFMYGIHWLFAGHGNLTSLTVRQVGQTIVGILQSVLNAFCLCVICSQTS